MGRGSTWPACGPAPCSSSRATMRRRSRRAVVDPVGRLDPAVIERLTAGGLGTPPFALVTWTGNAAGPARVLVRGDIEVASAARESRGSTCRPGPSAWSTRRPSSRSRRSVPMPRRDWFPIVDGVVAAGRVAVPASSTSSAPVVAAVGGSPLPMRVRCVGRAAQDARSGPHGGCSRPGGRACRGHGIRADARSPGEKRGAPTSSSRFPRRHSRQHRAHRSTSASTVNRAITTA